MAKELWEGDILLAVARAQGILYKATQQLLKRDKYDGLRAAKWLAAHNKIFTEIAEESRSGCGVDKEILAQAQKLAGEPEDLIDA